MYTNTSSKDLPKRAKKTALRLDGARVPLGSPLIVQKVQFRAIALSKPFFYAKNLTLIAKRLPAALR